MFWPELGQFFKEFRTAKGWSQRQAAGLAKRRGLAALGRGALLRLESGETKNPEPDALRAVAALYELSYPELVRRFVQHRYQIDVTNRQDDAGSYRLIELERQVVTLQESLQRVRELTSALAAVTNVATSTSDAGHLALDALDEASRARYVRAMQKHLAKRRAELVAMRDPRQIRKDRHAPREPS